MANSIRMNPIRHSFLDAINRQWVLLFDVFFVRFVLYSFLDTNGTDFDVKTTSRCLLNPVYHIIAKSNICSQILRITMSVANLDYYFERRC